MKYIASTLDVRDNSIQPNTEFKECVCRNVCDVCDPVIPFSIIGLTL